MFTTNKYKLLKEKYPDALILFRLRDFYYSCDEDAEKIGKTLGITVTEIGSERIAKFRFFKLDKYLKKFVRAGHRVAICEAL
ncbi:MAG: hypothetical protein IJP79_07310 [Paludibacteraceae bacterium]|nr:hypothetical protein [Paludibacteraceae bacterium]MBQ6963492.1 hypothetical protein [Paludibacteraceae bacterium]MBQ7662494.1 hypothetical protein [Prevotella sp.]MBQ7748281.1 hypothetical protein [Paludibacteraceae bacterium]